MRMPRPFFRASRGLWYVQLQGRQINLGADRQQAFEKYKDLIPKIKSPSLLQTVTSPGVVCLIDSFLDWCQKHREPRTFEWYQFRCQSFVDSIQSGMTVQQLKPFHVQQWADAQNNWNDGMKRGAMTAIQRALNWAVGLGHIGHSPIARLEKPSQGHREVVITQEMFDNILGLISDVPFTDLLTLAWETGARPQELLALEARHCEPSRKRWVFPQKESKGKKHIRVVYLSAKAAAITERLLAAHPTGHLLRNADGVPWTRHAVNCRFVRLQKKLGQKFCLYTFRHSFAQRMLEAGKDSLVVATLLGHRDVSMLGKVYSHLTQNPDHLRKSLIA